LKHPLTHMHSCTAGPGRSRLPCWDALQCCMGEKARSTGDPPGCIPCWKEHQFGLWFKFQHHRDHVQARCQNQTFCLFPNFYRIFPKQPRDCLSTCNSTGIPQLTATTSFSTSILVQPCWIKLSTGLAEQWWKGSMGTWQNWVKDFCDTQPHLESNSGMSVDYTEQKSTNKKSTPRHLLQLLYHWVWKTRW